MAVQVRPWGPARSRPAARAGKPGGRTPRLRSRAEIGGLRVTALLVVAVVLAIAIWGRLAYWQVWEQGALRDRADQEETSRLPLPATRGAIVDREGRPLAVNTIVYDVSVAPDQVAPADRGRVAGALAAALGLSADGVQFTLDAGGRFAYVAKRQPQQTADRVRALRLPGVYLQPQTQRSYLPGGTADVSLASDLLGFVNYDGQGQRGVEQYWQSQVGGRDGYASGFLDPGGHQIVLGPTRRLSPIPGADLTLTLDSNIQFAAEQAIADGVEQNHARGGSVVVLDSATGGVVAWAGYPAYDANRFPTTDPSRFPDPALSDLYEPGSVMKVVTMAGAIDAGRMAPDTVIDDPGYDVVGGYAIHDWDHRAHGAVTMTRVLEESYNVGAIKAMQMEGRADFLHYLGAFGFGRPSGVDVADEAWLPLPGPAGWRDSQLATASFGQGVTTNVVQMCAAINVVANQGRWVTPHVVEKVGGRPVPVAAGRPVISPQTAETVSRMMRSVVQHGSGYKARVGGFELDEAGKTGTAQMPENGRYSDSDVWASYAGFLPADHPRFTMLVVIDRPDNGSFDHNEGYYVAAPVWRRIAEQMVVQWHLTPEALAPV